MIGVTLVFKPTPVIKTHFICFSKPILTPEHCHILKLKVNCKRSYRFIKIAEQTGNEKMKNLKASNRSNFELGTST
jgi:hypothetical protein